MGSELVLTSPAEASAWAKLARFRAWSCESVSLECRVSSVEFSEASKGRMKVGGVIPDKSPYIRGSLVPAIFI